MDELLINRTCAAQHFGLWAAESKWFMRTFNAIRSGMLKPVAQNCCDDAEKQPISKIDSSGIAHIGIIGMMTKGGSSFGGASTIDVRQAIRAAARDDTVKTILLHIDSPGA